MDPHTVLHRPGATILAGLAARPQEFTLTRAELSASSDDPDATLDGEEEPVQPAVQEARYTGAVQRTVRGYGHGTAPDPPRGPATPGGDARSAETEGEEEKPRGAKPGYMPPGFKGSGFSAGPWTAPPAAAARVPILGPPVPAQPRDTVPSQPTRGSSPAVSTATRPLEEDERERDALLLDSATGGTPLPDPLTLSLPPPMSTDGRPQRDQRHHSAATSVDEGGPPIPTADEVRLNQCLDGKDQEGQELILGFLQRNLEKRRRAFTKRRRELRETKDAELKTLKAVLAKAEADKLRERKEYRRRTAEASTAAVAQQAQQRGIIQLLEAQVQAGHTAVGQALDVAVSAGPMDTSEAASKAPATDRQGAGSEIEDLRESLQATQEELGVATSRREALHGVVAEMRSRDEGRRAELENAQAQVVLLQAQLQTARAELATLESKCYAARVVAGLPTTSKDAKKEDEK